MKFEIVKLEPTTIEVNLDDEFLSVSSNRIESIATKGWWEIRTP
jgi:hypothetical protein